MKLFKASLLAGVVAASAVSQAFDTWNCSLVGDYNMGSPGIHASAGQGGNGAQIEVNGGGTFTGLDGSGATQTMTYAGTTRTSSQFGRLHSYTELTASNIYYNAANPDYQHADGSIDANGSPDGFTSLGFAGFNDTLHYGGLQIINYLVDQNPNFFEQDYATQRDQFIKQAQEWTKQAGFTPADMAAEELRRTAEFAIQQ